VKRYIVALVLLVFVSASVAAHNDELNMPVVLSYDQAVQLALRDLLPIHETDAQMRRMQNQRTELEEEIRRLNQNDIYQERISVLQHELWLLDMQIMNARNAQQHVMANTEQALQLFIPGLIAAAADEEGADEIFSQILQAIIQGVIISHELDNSIFIGEAQRAWIFNELWSAYDVQDKQDTHNDYIGEIDYRIEILNISQQQVNLIMENTLRDAVIANSELDSQIKMMDAYVQLLEDDVFRMRTMLEFGFVGASDVRLAQQDLIQARIDLDALHLRKNTAGQNLNHLLGAPLAQLTIVEFERVLPCLPEDLTSHIANMVSQTLTIQQLQLSADRARDVKNAYTGINEAMRDALREDYDLAVMTRNQAELTIEVALRRGISELEHLMTQEAALHIELENAKVMLDTAVVNLGLGRAIQRDVNQAEFAVLLIEHDIEIVLNRKWILGFYLANPSLFL